MFEIYRPPLKYIIPLQNLLLTPFARIQRGVQISSAEIINPAILSLPLPVAFS